jgi:hypothetical protein
MVDVLYHACRWLIAFMGTFLLLIVACVLFVAETILAFVCFPACAAFASRSWLHAHWPGTYPLSLKWFFSDRQGREEYETKPTLTLLGFSIGEEKELVDWEMRGGLRLIADMWLWVRASNSSDT